MVNITREFVLQKVQTAQARGENLDFQNEDFSTVDLSRMNLIKADLGKAKLHKTNLSWATLIKADLNRTDLSEADLRKADLIEANLMKANLHDADLSGADLSGADLSGANLSNANLEQATIGYTNFGDVDLNTVRGLETVQHFGPSYIDIHTLVRSKGRIPEKFLRGAGITETFITYIASLTGEAIQYYSCFISYSNKDEAFAQRLHADLQQNGVRCWFAPENMKIGRPIRQTIDNSIRIHDKLLIVLSENSIISRWVEKEVETAFEEEGKRDKIVLFPVRLDEAVMQTYQAWAADIRRDRHIGDFSRWKDHDAYQQAFERLLRDLKAEG